MTATIKQTLDEAKQQVSSLDAEILLAFVLNKSRTHLFAYPDQQLTQEQSQQFADYIKRCSAGEPVAYITGIKEFWSLPLHVTRDTLIPRPETELLVETILEIFPPNSQIQAADLGTGSGAIAIALAHERPMWRIVAVDVSESALTIARKNAQQFELNNISFCLGNWCTALPRNDFDVIVSNPPYIAEREWETYAQGLQYEPKNALTSGMDGLNAIREISGMTQQFLRTSGLLLLEHGFWQGQAVRDILSENGFNEVRSVKDLSGHERVTVGRKV